jgi:hypothetical protein
MNERMSELLSEDLATYMVDDILQEAKIKKVIGIYPGRFQPAGIHHYKT